MGSKATDSDPKVWMSPMGNEDGVLVGSLAEVKS